MGVFSEVVLQVPGTVPLRIGQDDSVCGLAVSSLAAEQEDGKGLTLEFLPLDSGDLPADEPGVVLPLRSGRALMPRSSEPSVLTAVSSRPSPGPSPIAGAR